MSPCQDEDPAIERATMTRTSPRPRRTVGPMTLAVLKPFVRYSSWRDAYVLRGVGDRTGPVLKRRNASRHPDQRLTQL
jgi:hypothetical protein